ncbi:hypothetical protein H0H93_015248 [Arthromyces matolae]|nr:hypothetical protein H0H93_015248 [Arthromyces matolae]
MMTRPTTSMGFVLQPVVWINGDDEQPPSVSIKVWQLDEANGSWSVQDDWKAHDAPVSKLSWAHPEFGLIIASSSFDRSVKVWEQTFPSGQSESSQQPTGSGSGSSASSQPSTSRWVERAVLTDARGTVRAVEFAPHHFGLKLATIASDNNLRIYECLEQPSITNWQLTEELDVVNLPSTGSPSFHSRAHTAAIATPTQINATLDATNASLVTQALQANIQQNGNTTPLPSTRQGPGNREADGGWCISWCKDRYWGELIAVGCGTNGIVKIIQLSPSRRPTTILTLDSTPSPPPKTSSAAEGSTSGPEPTISVPPAFAITTVSWAPSCGRSYHLIATGSRDGRVHIWRVKPGDDIDGEDEDEENKWTATVVADFDQHNTVLSSTGNDGRVRLWKATAGSVWRPAGSIGVEQSEESELPESKDVDMEG